MAFKKTKGEKGEANKYVTRKRACRMLQLDLPYFRRLCILKGVYPREPKSRKKAQKGDTRIKSLYLKRDIIYLSHEPIIWKIREEKIYRRKIKTLTGKKQYKEADFKKNLQRPKYKLDHIVLERYPTFDKALEDLDDALSAMFLYAVLPHTPRVYPELVQQCKKLTTEFQIYIMESQALTKSFISIRGYFYRAHIMGHKITWMVPHPFPIPNSQELEMKIMKSFIEFYCTLLGFVNYKLFSSLNLYYPPKLAEKVERSMYTSKQESVVNVIESLNFKLERNYIDQDDAAEDEYDKELITKKFNKKLKLAQQERDKILKQKNLFKDVKFFLGRETNRESLTIVIRSAGGLVSWDESVGPGHTYPEDDKTIQYQIVDRPEIQNKHLDRYYLQPQWVYDSFNTAIVLPVQNYFVGTELPAHLSPFEEAYHKLYNPPEMERIKALQNKIDLIGDRTMEELKKDIVLNDDDDDDELEEQPEEEEQGKEEVEEEIQYEAENIEDHEVELESNNMDDEEEIEEEVKEEVDDPLAKMVVKRGKPQRVNLAHEARMKDVEDFKLAASFIHRKQKRFFKKILKQEGKAKKYSLELRKKRILFEKWRLDAAKKKSRSSLKGVSSSSLDIKKKNGAVSVK